MLHQAIFLFGLIAAATAQNFAQNLEENIAPSHIQQNIAPSHNEQNITPIQLPNESQTFYPPPEQHQPTITRVDAGQQYILQAMMKISNGTEKFSLELYKILAFALDEQSEGRDFIISPFSVWSLLMLTAEGAKGNTYAQLQEVMGLPQDLTYIRQGYRHIQHSLKVNTTTIELAVEQVMFTDKNRPVDTDYEDNLLRVYEADIVPVDFSEAAAAYFAINDYVEEKTHGKISKIIQPEDLHDLQMVLISAIFFKGEWKFPFDPRDTKEEPFYDDNGNELGTVNMMSQLGTFGYAAHAKLQAHVVEWNGNENRLSMYVLLPLKGLSLSKVIENIGTVGLGQMITDIEESQAKYEDDEVEVFLPRIRITSDFTINVVLEMMGLTDIFDSPYLSRVIHKAKIEVNEEGTVAAAVTGGAFINKNTPSRFFANRPFAFVIVEKRTKLLLFSGQVKNPTKYKF